VGFALMSSLGAAFLAFAVAASVTDFNAGRQFIHTRAEQHSNLEEVKRQARANVPRSFSAAERDAFLADVERADDVDEVMELFLGFLGKATFDRVFPP
jgi:hypothetical protein